MSAFAKKLSEYGLYADSMDSKKEITSVEPYILLNGSTGSRILRSFLSNQGSIRVKDIEKMKQAMQLSDEYCGLPDMLMKNVCLEWETEDGFEFQVFHHPIRLYAEFQREITTYEAEFEKTNEEYRLGKIFNPEESLKRLERETFALFEEFLQPESNKNLLDKLEREFSQALWEDRKDLERRVGQ